MKNSCETVLVLILFVSSISTAVAGQPANGGRDLLQAGTGSYGCSASDIAHYAARRAAGPITIDGRLDEPSWQRAEKSPRFVDMVTGAPGEISSGLKALDAKELRKVLAAAQIALSQSVGRSQPRVFKNAVSPFRFGGK